MVDTWPGTVHVCPAARAELLFLKGKPPRFKGALPRLPTLTKSHAMLRNISQAPALLTSVHMAVREQEAQAAVTLNDFMNRSEPFRAHCLAVSCFDMGPNTSLHLAKGFGFRALCMRRKTAHGLQSQERCFFWLAERDRLWHVAHTGLDGCQSLLLISHLPLRPSVCLSVTLSVWRPRQTAAKKVREWMSSYLSGVSLT